MKALTACSHIYHPDGVNNTLLSQVRILDNGSGYRNSGQNIYFKDQRKGWEAPSCPGPALVSMTSHTSQWSPPTMYHFPQACPVSSWIHYVTHISSPASKSWSHFSACKATIYSSTSSLVTLPKTYFQQQPQLSDRINLFLAYTQIMLHITSYIAYPHHAAIYSLWV